MQKPIGESCMDYKNEYFTEEIGLKIYPESVFNLSRLTLSNPEVMAVFSGLQITIGEDVFYLYKELIGESKKIIPICSRLQNERLNLELREKDMRASAELLERKKEVIWGRLKEIEGLTEEYIGYLNKMDADGMSVCAKVLVNKHNDTENDSIECKSIKRELEKYTNLFNDASESYNELKTVSDNAVKNFVKKINELQVKDLTIFNNFIETDEDTLKTIVDNGVKCVNENLVESVGGKLDFDEVFLKVKFLLITLAGFYETVSTIVWYMKEVCAEGELDFSIFDTKKAKRYKTILENFEKFIQNPTGVQYVFSVLPTKLKKNQMKAIEIFNEYLSTCIESGAGVKTHELEEQLLEIAKKNQDELMLGLYGVMNGLKMYSLSLSTKNINVVEIDEEDLVHQLLTEANTKRLFD